ncbi:hypothetical protein ABEV55_06200 [Aneurinibacillus thermoaerophilus]|uniref:hypothetical protein n=1 Tax=Aneurinibacillus thermoaerophilus TaxID=143495 RepID=UPI002E1D19AE|nr:hypothetical protein [Aneurinibacillus thermoaerophilus]
MGYQVKGLMDIHTVLSNERKLGGVIEVEYLRLRSGEQFPNAVITSIEMAGNAIYSVGFITEQGKQFIAHVDEISIILEPVHKRICEMSNESYRQIKTVEKLKYLKKLLQANAGSCTPTFRKEVEQLVDDIGVNAAANEVDLSFMEPRREDKKRGNRIRIA